MLRSHLPPTLLTVEVSRDGGQTWQFYLPSTDGTWTNPTTEVYMANLLGAQAEREGLAYVRCWQQEGSRGQPTLRWDASTLVETDVEHLPDDEPADAFARPRRRW